MKRITPKEIKEAIRKTSLIPCKPMHSDSKVRACPLEILFLNSPAEVIYVGDFLIRAAIGWANQVYGPKYVDGFQDGCNEVIHQSRGNSEYLRGYRDGTLIYKEVLCLNMAH